MLETLRQCRLIVYGIIADSTTARQLLAEGLQANILGKELTVARQQVFTSATRKRMRTSAQTRCPFCAERIASDLHVCPFCESNLAPRRSRVTLVKPERSARAAVITSSIGIAFLLGVALLHSLHETRPSARIPNQSVASAATPVRHNPTQSSVLPRGWQYYSAENGAYELVNKELPYRGDASASDWGCQGVGAANPDAPVLVELFGMMQSLSTNSNQSVIRWQ